MSGSTRNPTSNPTWNPTSSGLSAPVVLGLCRSRTIAPRLEMRHASVAEPRTVEQLATNPGAMQSRNACESRLGPSMKNMNHTTQSFEYFDQYVPSDKPVRLAWLNQRGQIRCWRCAKCIPSSRRIGLLRRPVSIRQGRGGPSH